jgi:hypothetical protein
VDDLLPALASVMILAAIAGMLGPAVKLIRAFSPNFLLKAAWSSEKACRPPKVLGPAVNAISGSFFAPPISSFNTCASAPIGFTQTTTITATDQLALITVCRPICLLSFFRNRVSLESPGFPRQRTMHHGVACELYTQREIVLPALSLGKAHLRWYEIGLTSPSHT